MTSDGSFQAERISIGCVRNGDGCAASQNGGKMQFQHRQQQSNSTKKRKGDLSKRVLTVALTSKAIKRPDRGNALQSWAEPGDCFGLKLDSQLLLFFSWASKLMTTFVHGK